MTELAARCPTGLPLSAVAPAGTLHRLSHDHHPRLCARCIAVRFRRLNPVAPTRADHIASAIAAHDGNVWPAIAAYGISYRHAVRIRRGWRPGGVRALPIPYSSRGYTRLGRRPGYSWVLA